MKKFLGLTFLTASLAAAPAMAAEGDITGLLIVRSNSGDITSITAPNLTTTEQCLSLAWISSQSGVSWRSKEATVTCLQGGNVIAAQACDNGECKAINAPSMQPERK